MSTESKAGDLHRTLNWKGAFWVAAGVPPLVLFSIGGIAGVAGQAAFVVWMLSMIMGFSQSFTYAEMAGMFGNKSGGTSVYGATAWLRYSKLIAPLSVWCNWFAWSPVLSLGCAIAAGYILNALFPIPLETAPQVVAWVAAHLADYTAATPAVVDYIAANAGTTPEAAIQAVANADGPGLRTMSDIDIMVPERDLAKAEHVMVGLGFGPLPRPDLEEFCRRSNHLARLSRPKSVPVEVHWTIERPTSPFTIDVDALWRRAQPIALGGLEVLALSPEDLLLHLCLHTSYHHRFDRMALKGLVDIDMVVAAFEGRLDWRQVARTAREWGAGSYVYSTLRLATMILETPVPKAALASLDRKMEDETIIELARQFALTPIVDLPPGFREVRASRSLPKRAASVARGIFLPRRHMRRLYGLRDGSPLVYLYYGVRVFDLLRHRGALGLQVLLHTRRVQPALFREAARKRITAWVGTTPATPEE